MFFHYHELQFILSQFKFNTPVLGPHILLSTIVNASILKIANALITVTVLETFTINYNAHLYYEHSFHITYLKPVFKDSEGKIQLGMIATDKDILYAVYSKHD